MLSTNSELKRLIDELWNKFWSGGIANPLTAIEQITYLIFIRKLDENDSLFKGVYPEVTEKEQKDIDSGEKDNLKRVQKSKLRWRNFSKIKSREEKLELVRDFVFPFIKKLNGEHSSFTKYMKNAVFVISSASLLDDAIKTIDELYIEIEKDAKENSFQDIQGDVYEMLLNQLSSAGKNGQFRTPRHIIELVTDLVDPKRGDKIGDPACGTGGFLLGAYQHVEDKRKGKKITSYYGYDIDVTMVRLGLMNLMMHGINDPKIEYTDTLGKGFNQKENDTYDVILANPPFTGSLNKDEIDETLLLKKNNNSSKTELLFIERIHKMLKKGGTAGIIIPQGVLFGNTKAFVKTREIMIEESQLKAVISLPSGVFQPYAGVATAILIFRKGYTTKDVFFYDMESDGYSLDVKRKKLDGNSDIDDIIEKYKNDNIGKSRESKYFIVSKKEIVDNEYDLSVNRYREVSYNVKVYDEPSVILEKLSNLEDEIQSELKKVKSLFDVN